MRFYDVLLRARPWLGLVLGVVLLAALTQHVDWQEAWRMLGIAGPLAVLVLVALHLVVLGLDVRAWQQLVPPGQVGFGELFVMRWIAESVNNMAPVAQVGGEVVRATLLRGRLGALAPAVLSVSADFIATAASLAPIALLGIFLLSPPHGVMLSCTILLAWLGFIGLLRNWHALSDWVHAHLARVRARLEDLDRRQFARAWMWHVSAWLCGAGEIYLGLWLLGHPVTATEALAIECVLQTSRAVVFMGPAGIGIQEGAIVALSAWAGVPHAVGLGLALLKRAREVSLGISGLLAWGGWVWYQRTGRPSTF